MHTEKWSQEVERLTNAFQAAFAGLTREELNWKTDEKYWSIGQVLDHIMLLNQSYFPIIQQVRQGTYKVPFTGKLNFLVHLFRNMLLKAVQPNNRKKTKTFPVWEPAKSNITEDVVEKFIQHQAQLKQLFLSSTDLIENGTVISSPANKYIVYKLETAFEILIAHEQRHLEQAKEVLRLQRPGADSVMS